MSTKGRIVAEMHCSEVLADLSDYLDDGLTTMRRAQIEAHLRGCDWCERFGNEFALAIRALRACLGAAPAVETAIADRLSERLRKDLG